MGCWKYFCGSKFVNCSYKNAGGNLLNVPTTEIIFFSAGVLETDPEGMLVAECCVVISVWRTFIIWYFDKGRTLGSSVPGYIYIYIYIYIYVCCQTVNSGFWTCKGKCAADKRIVFTYQTHSSTLKKIKLLIILSCDMRLINAWT